MGTTYKIPATAMHAVLKTLVALYNADREAAVSTSIHYTTTPRGGIGDLENPSAPTALAVTGAAVAIDVDATVDETATVTSDDAYSGDAILTDATWDEPDYLVLTCDGEGAFTAGSTVTVTGTYLGAAVSDVLTIVGANGETVYGDQLFDPNSVTAVAVAAQADTDGTIAIGRAKFPEAAALANEIKGVVNAHFADTVAHDTAVSAQVTTADATSLATAYALASALKTAYVAHLSASNVHANNDETNTIAAAAATTIATLNALVNELRADVTAHIAASLAGSHIELV